MNKLSIKTFLEFVEIRTKIASVIPLLAGILWSSVLYDEFNFTTTILFTIAVILFDMCTTAINNTMDYIKAVDMTYRNTENVIGKYQLSLVTMKRIIVVLLALSIAGSLVLVTMTHWLLLFFGGICFVIGICYTFGPVTISRTPFGEIFSGVTMGFGIMFLAIYIQNPSLLISTNLTSTQLMIEWQWWRTLEIVYLSLPLVCLIATIMLANNCCDIETDISNERYTLVYYLGIENSLVLYQILSMIPWICYVTYILLGYFPVIAGVGLLGIYPHYLSVQRFKEKQIKQVTFIEAIKSFKLYSGIYLTVLVYQVVMKLIF